MWTNFSFLHMFHVQNFEISPHDRFFLHGPGPSARDKYEVCIDLLSTIMFYLNIISDEFNMQFYSNTNFYLDLLSTIIFYLSIISYEFNMQFCNNTNFPYDLLNIILYEFSMQYCRNTNFYLDILNITIFENYIKDMRKIC